MADGFEQMVDGATAFFAELERNNTRDWFEPRKEVYRREIRAPAGLFAGLYAEDLGRLTGRTHVPKVFRLHRDLRFSHDKRPCNARLHMMWAPAARAGLGPAWFFGAAPDYLVFGCGIMEFRDRTLAAFRAHVDRDGDRLATAIREVAAATGARLSDHGPPPLARVPRPYPADHPQGDLLRRRGLALVADLSAGWRGRGLAATLDSLARAMLPFARAFGGRGGADC